MKLIELFAGIGTQINALKEIDTCSECIGISEIDKRALKAYEVLNGKVNNFGDITKIKSLPAADIWSYSFPCTDISIAGNKAGFEGPRSSLIFEVYRLLKNSPKPRILLMENVSNLCNETFMPQFQEWIDALEELGYNSSWKKIKAHTYGGGTIRDRVFMISAFHDEKFIFPKENLPTTVLNNFLEPINENYFIDISTLQDINEPYYRGAKKLADYNRGGQGNRIYSIYAQGVTLTASGGGKAGSSGGLYLRDGKIYKLSPIEMCKVMGWTKEEADKICSVLSPREVGFCLGNAIDKTVMKKIFKAIQEQYFKE